MSFCDLDNSSRRVLLTKKFIIYVQHGVVCCTKKRCSFRNSSFRGVGWSFNGERLGDQQLSSPYLSCHLFLSQIPVVVESAGLVVAQHPFFLGNISMSHDQKAQ